MPTAEGLFTRAELDESIANAVKERIAEASRASKNLRDEMERIQARVKELEPMESRAKDLETQVRRQSNDLVAARAGITDPKAARRLRAAYEADMEDVVEKDRPTLEAWIATDDGKAVAGQFRPQSAPPPPAPPAPAQPAQNAAAANPPAPVVAPPPAASAVGIPAPPPAARLTREAYTKRSRELLDRRARAPADEKSRIDAEIRALNAQATAPPTP